MSEPPPLLPTSFDKMESRRESALFKVRAAAHAIIAVNKEKKLAFDKKKIEWKRKEGRYDDVSDQVFTSMEALSPAFPVEPGDVVRPKQDSREIFYTHNVEATKELCVSCFDGLLSNIKRLEDEKKQQKQMEDEMKEGMKMAKLAGKNFSLEEMQAMIKDGDEETVGDIDGDGDENDEHDRDQADEPHKPLIKILPKFRTSSCPVFITWAKEGVTLDDLFVRGKGGSMAPVNLSKDLVRLAIEAGSYENQLNFFPIRRNELPRLKVALEIPNSYESLYNPGDWVPEVHGLAMRFTDR